MDDRSRLSPGVAKVMRKRQCREHALDNMPRSGVRKAHAADGTDPEHARQSHAGDIVEDKRREAWFLDKSLTSTMQEWRSRTHTDASCAKAARASAVSARARATVLIATRRPEGLRAETLPDTAGTETPQNVEAAKAHRCRFVREHWAGVALRQV